MKLQHYGGLRVNKMKKNKVTIVLVGILFIVLIANFIKGKMVSQWAKISGYYYIDMNRKIATESYGDWAILHGFDANGIAMVEYETGGTFEDNKVIFLDQKFRVLGNRVFRRGDVIKWVFEGKDYFICIEGNNLQILDSNMAEVATVENFNSSYEITGYTRFGHCEGLIAICDIENEKYGFMSIDGEIVIEPRFLQVQAFSSDDVAVVMDENKKYGVIDKSGEYIIEPRFYNIGNFSHGLAMAQEQENGEARIIDLKGSIVSENLYRYDGSYEMTNMFEERLARVQDYNTGLYGAIDDEGKEVIPPSYKDMGLFANGYAYIEDENGKCGFIDEENKIVVPCQYDSVSNFSVDGVAPVMVGDLWGYIRTDNTWFLKPQFQNAYSYENGYAIVWLREGQSVDRYENRKED